MRRAPKRLLEGPCGTGWWGRLPRNTPQGAQRLVVVDVRGAQRRHHGCPRVPACGKASGGPRGGSAPRGVRPRPRPRPRCGRGAQPGPPGEQTAGPAAGAARAPDSLPLRRAFATHGAPSPGRAARRRGGSRAGSGLLPGSSPFSSTQVSLFAPYLRVSRDPVRGRPDPPGKRRPLGRPCWGPGGRPPSGPRLSGRAVPSCDIRVLPTFVSSLGPSCPGGPPSAGLAAPGGRARQPRAPRRVGRFRLLRAAGGGLKPHPGFPAAARSAPSPGRG